MGCCDSDWYTAHLWRQTVLLKMEKNIFLYSTSTAFHFIYLFPCLKIFKNNIRIHIAFVKKWPKSNILLVDLKSNSVKMECTKSKKTPRFGVGATWKIDFCPSNLNMQLINYHFSVYSSFILPLYIFLQFLKMAPAPNFPS